MSNVLVTIINNKTDFEIAKNKCWYRIPVISAEKWLSQNWPPKWIAFYQTKAFGSEAYSINYYAKIISIRKVFGKDILPERKDSTKSNKIYYQIFFDSLLVLPNPILSRRWRRIVFIPTTLEKLLTAFEINDLYDGSPLEDKLWVELKRLKIKVNRQEYIEINAQSYFLDFAIYCMNGKIDIETDGDKWHHNAIVAPKDNIRNNSLSTFGWDILRFTKYQITNEMISYCIPNITQTINNLGGVKEHNDFSRRIYLDNSDIDFQFGLFDL